MALVALALLLVAGGVAVAAQNYFFTPQLRFILGCSLQASALFPILAFSLIYLCKKHERESEQAGALPLEIWQEIADRIPKEHRLSGINALRRSCYKLSSLKFKPQDLFLGLGRGNYRETTVQHRSFINFFHSCYGAINKLQICQNKLYILETRTMQHNRPLACIMVWNLETQSFDTKDLLGFETSISSFYMEGNLLYLVHQPVNSDERKRTIWNLKTRSKVAELPLGSDYYDVSLLDNFVVLSCRSSEFGIQLCDKNSFEKIYELYGIKNYFLDDDGTFFFTKHVDGWLLNQTQIELGKFPFKTLTLFESGSWHFYPQSFLNIAPYQAFSHHPSFPYERVCNSSDIAPFARINGHRFLSSNWSSRCIDILYLSGLREVFLRNSHLICKLRDTFIIQKNDGELELYSLSTLACLGTIPSIGLRMGTVSVINDTSLALGSWNGSIRLLTPKNV